MAHEVVYGLDIETQHAGRTAPGSGAAIDPLHSRVTRVALSTPARDWSFTGEESDLLEDLDATLRTHEPGILASWNGSGFALPYLADRAALHGVQLGLRLAADPRLRPRGETLVGHVTLYRAAWYGHVHLDAARLYRSGRRPLIDVTELLRTFGRHGRPCTTAGTGPADVPGGELSHGATHAFAANDARLVRSMIEARLPGVIRHIDRVTIPTRPSTDPSMTAVERLRVHLDPVVPRMSPAHPAVRAALMKDLATPKP